MTSEHAEKCPVKYGAQTELCTCVPPEKEPMSSAERLLIAGFILLSGGLGVRLGFDIAAAVDGVLLIVGAVLMVRNGNGGEDATGS